MMANTFSQPNLALGIRLTSDYPLLPGDHPKHAHISIQTHKPRHNNKDQFMRAARAIRTRHAARPRV